MDVRGPGTSQSASDAWRAELANAADWTWHFAASAYGPGGGDKLLVGAEHDVVPSGAAALADVPSTHPVMDVFIGLARRLRAGGDQATGGVLLAAALVRGALASPASRPAILEGYAAAKRQVLGWLDSRPNWPGPPLAAVDPWGIAADVLDGLQRWDVVDLDRVHVHPGRRAAWGDGLHVELHGDKRPVAGPILLLQTGPRIKPAGSAVWRTNGEAAEEAIRRRWLDDLAASGAVAVFCRTGLGALRDRVPVPVADNVPADLAWRIEHATGAELAARLDEDSVLGEARLQPETHRIGGWRLHGGGPSATLWFPRSTAAREAASRMQAEALLRTAGRWLESPRCIEGGGAWQRDAAAALRRSAPLAEGSAALAIEAAARALDACRRALVANTGVDALDVACLPPIADVAPCVRDAVEGAFDAAIGLLRLDGRYSRRPSDAPSMRGGTGPAGSPKGMPGDIPPLM